MPFAFFATFVDATTNYKPRTTIQLVPRRVDRRPDEERRIGARPRLELLHAAVADLRNVQIPLLVDARRMRVEELARCVAEDAPRVQQVSLGIPLHDPRHPVHE